MSWIIEEGDGHGFDGKGTHVRVGGVGLQKRGFGVENGKRLLIFFLSPLYFQYVSMTSTECFYIRIITISVFFQVEDRDAITKTFHFIDFQQAWNFMSKVADLAETVRKHEP